MKTISITIQIQIPDGAGVQVSQGGQPVRSSGGSDFIQRPDPGYPPAPCEECGGDWKLIKAGVSKTKVDDDGNPKRFNAFYACATPRCDGKPNYSVAADDGIPF